MSGLRVLVIGGTRFVGRLLAWRLIAAGHRVTLFNRGTAPDPFGSLVERLRGDRTTLELDRLLAGRGFDAVVDFAAYTADDARRAVDVLADRVGHYVFISSGQVYLVREGYAWPARETQYDGPLLPEPVDPYDREEWRYGVRKRAAEDVLAAAWSRDRFPSTRIRIPMVNGERDHFRRIEGYLWRILDGGPVLLPDGGTVRCRHVYGDELARAIVGLLGQPLTFGEAYNLCQAEAPSLAELVAALCAGVGAPVRTVAVPAEEMVTRGLGPAEVSPFSDRWMSHLDPSRAVTALGFRHLPLREYLPRIIASFLAHAPVEPPAGYARRAEERALGARRSERG